MTYKIFTSGKMSGLSYEDSMKWRKEIEEAVLKIAENKVVFIHPPQFFHWNGDNQEFARKWEINQIADSDIVIVDLSTISGSIGTHIELGVIEGLNRTRNKKIEVVGFGKADTEHPWIDLGLTYKAGNIEEAAEFINDYLLI